MSTTNFPTFTNSKELSEKSNQRLNNYERQLFVVQSVIKQSEGTRENYAVGHLINPAKNNDIKPAVLRLMDTQEFAQNIMQTRRNDTVVSYQNKETNEQAHYLRDRTQKGSNNLKLLSSAEYAKMLDEAKQTATEATVPSRFQKNVRESLVAKSQRIQMPAILNLDAVQTSRLQQQTIDVDGKALPIISAKWSNLATNTAEGKIMSAVVQIAFEKMAPGVTTPRSKNHIPLEDAYSAKLIVLEPNPKLLSGNFSGLSANDKTKRASDNLLILASSLNNQSLVGERRPHVFVNLVGAQNSSAANNIRIPISPMLESATRLAPQGTDYTAPGTEITYLKAKSAAQTLSDYMRKDDFYTKKYLENPNDKKAELGMLAAEKARAVISSLANEPLSLAVPSHPKAIDAKNIYDQISTGSHVAHLFSGQQIDMGPRSSSDLIKKFIGEHSPVSALHTPTASGLKAYAEISAKQDMREIDATTAKYMENEVKLKSNVLLTKGIVGYQPFADGKDLYASYFEPISLNKYQIAENSIKSDALTIDKLTDMYGADKGKFVSFNLEASDKKLFDPAALPKHESLVEALRSHELNIKNGNRPSAITPDPITPNKNKEADKTGDSSNTLHF